MLWQRENLLPGLVAMDGQCSCPVVVHCREINFPLIRNLTVIYKSKQCHYIRFSNASVADYLPAFMPI